MDIEKMANELAEKEKENQSINNSSKMNENSDSKNELTIAEGKELSVQDANSNDIDLQNIQKHFLKKQVDSGKTLNEITTDYAHASITNEIFSKEDEQSQKFKNKLKKEKQEELSESFKKEKIKSQSETIAERHKKAEALYTAFRPILEFDFSNLIKKKNDNNMQQTNKVDYSDRAYGITMMSIMLVFLTIPYICITILLALFNGLNAIFEMINTFGKIAKGIGLTIFFIILGVLIIYIILLGIQIIFGVDLMGMMRSWF